MRWGIAIGVVLLAAAAWPADGPPVHPPAMPEPMVDAPPVPAPVPVAPEKPRAGPRRNQRDPADPQPPPEPPPPRPVYPLGEVQGNVEDEAGSAVPCFRVTSRTFRRGHRRGYWPAGHGVAGAGGTFRFRVRRLDFHLDPVPPGSKGNRTLFTIRADEFVDRPFPLSEDDEFTLRRNGRVTCVRIVLERAVVVEGRVFLPNGHAAPGHRVTIRRRKDGRYDHVCGTTSDKQGWFRFAHLEAAPDLHVHAAVRLVTPRQSAESGHIPLGDDIVPGETIRIDVRLGPWIPGN